MAFPPNAVRRAAVLAVLLHFSPLAEPGRAATMSYSAIDLADTAPGQDLWEYSYQLSDATFLANQGFTVFFDRTLFTLLQIPPSLVSTDWDLLIVQPDVVLNSNGFFDGLALRDNPSLADPFTVQFVWLGTGAPDSQPFVIYDTNFQPIFQGQTTSGVPEPSVFALLLPVAAAFAGRRKRTLASNSPPQHFAV